MVGKLSSTFLFSITAWVVVFLPFFLRSRQLVEASWGVGRSTASPSVHVSQEPLFGTRGGAAPTSGAGGGLAVSSSKKPEKISDELQAYLSLAAFFREKLVVDESGALPSLSEIVKAFRSMSSAQQAFKGLDGAAHEMYQRTHTANEVDVSVSGRARRSVARTAATAGALGACELCELVEFPYRFDMNSPNGTLYNRDVVLNVTDYVTTNGMNVSILVLYEASYRGGAGVHHGGIDDLVGDDHDDVRERAGNQTPARQPRNGRLLIVIRDSCARNLIRTLKLLDEQPIQIRTPRGQVSDDIVSVQPVLYDAAGSVLKVLEPVLRAHNSSAIHFTGYSLGGAVASLAAIILEGHLPMPPEGKPSKAPRKSKKKKRLTHNVTGPDRGNATCEDLHEFGKGRTSATVLGVPPTMSANLHADYVTSILYGDDLVCRSSKESMGNFVERARRALKNSGLVGRQLNWMTDTLSLATTSLKGQGGEGLQTKLAVPGRAYLVRPRRLGGFCSMHEVGGQLKGGREAIRAAVLWQLNEMLLSKSLWKHHQLESYIQGLDRVHLRGMDDDDLTTKTSEI